MSVLVEEGKLLSVPTSIGIVSIRLISSPALVNTFLAVYVDAALIPIFSSKIGKKNKTDSESTIPTIINLIELHELLILSSSPPDVTNHQIARAKAIILPINIAISNEASIVSTTTCIVTIAFSPNMILP